MKTIVMVVALVVLISIIGLATAGDNTPKIEIDDTENKAMYQKFDIGDPWNITLSNSSTGDIRYEFDGTIGMDGTELSGNNWKVWFNCVSPGAKKHGIERIIVPGTYDVFADGTRLSDSRFVQKEGTMTVSEDNIRGCGQPIPPIPEIATAALVGMGLLGLVLVSRKHRKE